MNRLLSVIACILIITGCKEQQQTQSEETERRNIEVANAHMEAFFRGDTATLVSMYAEDAVIIPYMMPGIEFGRTEFVAALYREFILAFPGAVSSIEGEFAKGDLVCLHGSHMECILVHSWECRRPTSQPKSMRAMCFES